MAEANPDQADHHEITVLTAEIVGAYVGHHKVATTDLPSLIATVGQELAGLGQAPVKPEEEKPHARRADQEVGPAGPHCLPGLRQAAKDAEATSDDTA